MGQALQASATLQLQHGEHQVVGRSAEVGKALVLIARDTCVSAANLSNKQHRDERNSLAMEVQRLMLIQKTKGEAEWQDPDTQKLNTSGLEQLSDIKKAIKDLGKLRAGLEDVEKSSPKSTPPKGEKPSPPAQPKRSASADVAPAPKKRQTGLSKPKMNYSDVADPEDEIDAAAKPIAERTCNSPGRIAPEPPGKGKGKGKGKGRGKGKREKPALQHDPRTSTPRTTWPRPATTTRVVMTMRTPTLSPLAIVKRQMTPMRSKSKSKLVPSTGPDVVPR